MATAILDKLLETQFGKSFIFWVFLALAAANAAQFIDGKNKDKKLEICNGDRVEDQRWFSTERERIIREQITFYQSMLHRLEADEKKKKR